MIERTRVAPVPTPEEIRARAAIEREAWNAAMYAARRVGDTDPGPYTIPVVRTPTNFERVGDSDS